MKKFIAAAAGLMLAGTMASTAFAAVEVSGDARLRYYYQDNYINLADSDDTHANSRVRMAVKGTTESGAYAKARLKWNNDRMGDTFELAADYAFISVPMGPITVQAGQIPTHITAMVGNDVDRDSVLAVYKDDMNSVIAMVELTEDDATAANDDGYNYIARYELTTDMINAVAGVVYADPADADSAFTGTVRLAQDFGAVNYSIDYAFVENAMGDDDGHMGYITVGVPTGEAGSVAFIAGMTKDGAVMDVPVGFTMLAGDQTITPGGTANVGKVAGVVENTTVETVDGVEVSTTTYDDIIVDTWIAGIVANYQVTEKSSIRATAAYADMEEAGDGSFDSSAWEVGATYKYAISAGVSTFIQLGYMDVDELDDNQFGAGVGLDVAF